MKKVMITFREGGENGGPYNSHKRIMESRLSEEYEFIPLIIPKGRLGLINLKLTKTLISQIRSNKPDIVHFTGLELVGFHVALACRLLGIKKTIVAIHGSTSESILHNNTLLKKRIISFLEYLTLRWAGYSYGVSQYVSSWNKVKKYSNNYFGHIYNIVENNLKVSTSNILIREHLGIEKDKLIAVSTGRIVKEKGYDILSKVIQNDDNDNLVYIIVGDGDFLPEMKRQLKKEIDSNKVHFLGYRNDVFSILTECDLCVMATLHETLCMSLAEAGYEGLALVASNVGGIPEIIVDGYNGFLIDVGSVSDFNKKINELSRNIGLLKKMKLQSKKYITEKFSASIIEKQLALLYEEVK